MCFRISSNNSQTAADITCQEPVTDPILIRFRGLESGDLEGTSIRPDVCRQLRSTAFGLLNAT